jgi:hypothetical protein
VNATLDALYHDSLKGNKKYDKLQVVGGCSALVHLMQNCLDKAIDKFPACDQVTKLNEVAELTTLNKTPSSAGPPFVTKVKLKFKRLVAWKRLSGYCKAFQSSANCIGVRVVPCVTFGTISYTRLFRSIACDIHHAY